MTPPIDYLALRDNFRAGTWLTSDVEAALEAAHRQQRVLGEFREWLKEEMAEVTAIATAEDALTSNQCVHLHGERDELLRVLAKLAELEAR